MTSEEIATDSPSGGGDDEVDKEEKEGEEDKQKQREVTPPRNPLEEEETSKKIKVSQLNLHRGRSPKLLSQSFRLCSWLMTSTLLSQLYQTPRKIFCREMKKTKKPCMKELKQS